MASSVSEEQHHVSTCLELSQDKHTRLMQDHGRLPYRASASFQKWLLCLLFLCLIATPVMAQPDHTSDGHEPIIAIATILILAGHQFVAFSGTLIGPSMGISSVLWLVMRNDAAIEPEWSWM